MKRFLLAVALTGLMSVTVLAGNIPTNGVVGEVPTNGAVGEVPINGAAAPTSSTLLTNAVLTIITTLTGR